MARGIGTLPHPPKNIDDVIVTILTKLYEKQLGTTIICVPDMNVRYNFVKTLKEQETLKNLLENKTIKVFTEDYVNKSFCAYANLMVILYFPTKLTQRVLELISTGKFNLAVLDKLFDARDLSELYKVAPYLPIKLQTTENTPVEDEYRSVQLNEEDRKLYDYYTKEINDTISIFGSYDNCMKAINGDTIANVGAIAFCEQIALEHGWNENLDKDSPFEMNIDAYYNPSNLRNRAIMLNDHIRKRKALCTSNKEKLKIIKDTVFDNPNKHICIINYDTDFAKQIVDSINEIEDIARNYHEKLDSVPIYDEEGNRVVYKTGAKAGQVKYAGPKMQMTYNMAQFNGESNVRVLSTNNLPNKELNIKSDIVIITSPYCELLNTYIYRLKSLINNSYTLKLVVIYTIESIEEKQFGNVYGNDKINDEYFAD